MRKVKPTYKELEERVLQLETELKREFNKDDEKFRMIFNTLTEAISLHKMITDDKGQVIDFTYEELNPAREKMINLKFSEIKDKTVRQVNPDIADGFIEQYGVIAMTGNPLSFEYYTETFNKHLIVKAFSPKYGYVATIIEDVTEQKKLKEMLDRTLEKYRTIFENSVEGIVLINDTGTVIEWNKCIETRTGISKESAIGKKLWDIQFSVMSNDWKNLYPVGDLQRIWINLITNLSENEIFKEEGQFVDYGGRIVITEDIICPINLNGEKHLCIIQRDLTERRNAELELKKNEQKLQQLNATKDKLFSVIAHDLRSPFNSILGYSRHLRENIRKYEAEESEKYLDIINSTAQNTFNLLINLLSWARHQTGQTIFSPETLHLQQIIAEVVDILSSSAKIKNISIYHNLPGKLMIYADRNMLKTILQNLVSNAVKFTNPGGEIQIYAVPYSDHVEVTVSDNGIGIHKKMIRNLFSIETNSPTTSTINESGSGLGLVICREFVEKHGGKIWVESRVGKGSNFKFTLPANKEYL
jgi:PAS domain S-box-containing protein